MQYSEMADDAKFLEECIKNPICVEQLRKTYESTLGFLGQHNADRIVMAGIVILVIVALFIAGREVAKQVKGTATERLLETCRDKLQQCATAIALADRTVQHNTKTIDSLDKLLSRIIPILEKNSDNR